DKCSGTAANPLRAVIGGTFRLVRKAAHEIGVDAQIAPAARYLPSRSSWLFFLCWRFQVGVEAVEASTPEAAVKIHPLRRAGERFGFEAASAMLALPLIRNERGF